MPTFGNGRYSKELDCKCEHNFTCGHCLRQAGPTLETGQYFFQGTKKEEDQNEN